MANGVPGLVELDEVAFGILGVEPVAAVDALLEVADVGGLVGEEVGVQSGGVGGVVGGGGHAGRRGVLRGEGEDFDELGGGEVIAGAGGVLGIGAPGGAEDVGIESFGGGGVRGVDGHVRDAGDGGTGLGEGGGRR